MSNYKQKGFSLIELMIVIAIIGILAAIAVPSYQNYVIKSKTAKLLNYIQAGQTAVEEYVASTGDTNCNNLTGPSSTPSDLDGYYYGDGWCGAEADGLASDFGGLPFYLWYEANISSNGSVTWQCFYYNDNCEGQDFAPNDCISGCNL